jgi:hypothetical protein
VLRRILILGCVLGAFFVGAPSGSAALIPLPECDADPATNAPCVVEVKKNGVAFPYEDADGPSEYATAQREKRDGTWWFDFFIWAPPPDTGAPWPFTLDPADRYSITINTKNILPGETFARGNDVEVDRQLDGLGHHLVTFEQNPVRAADDSCTGAGVCLMTANRTLPGYLDGHIDNLAYISDPDDEAAMSGFDLASNIDWVSSPLELDYLTDSIFLRVNNAHFESDGTTVFQGLAEFKLPFPMLRRLYHVDDPASLTSAAFSVTGAGGAATTTVEVDPSGETVRVDIDGITFSKKRLRITGDTRPTRPQNVDAVRVSAYRGRVTFDPAQSRGSRVREYRAYCRHQSRAGDFFSWKEGEDSPLVLRELKPGLRYECTVRARSRAGFGPAVRVTMPRVP